MIRRPTVFVLGAGASAPYGFPLGGKLTEDISKALSASPSGDFMRDIARASSKDADTLRTFGMQLRASGRYSIDEFLQWHPEFKDIGKLAIARMLIPCERDDRIDPSADATGWLSSHEEDLRWYRYLFDHLLRSRSGRCRLQDNDLQIVTFNFDRSFERALFRFVSVNCAKNESDAIEQTRAIPVFHVQGLLGVPGWMPEYSEFAVGRRRDYVPETSEDLLRTCAEQIRIVDDEDGPSETRERAVEALASAEVICFLGFSYHPLNLQKLKIETFAHKEVFGTALGLPPGRQRAVEKTFQEADRKHRSHSIVLAARNILSFLEVSDVIHD